ncbi:hypothetical protein BDZ89DRAFT_1124203 [Hymenopellis radicata]|nr:hypothetical protein BDZ89DRAFT_1124203 [Hymenopellis radicata]
MSPEVFKTIPNVLVWILAVQEVIRSAKRGFNCLTARWRELEDIGRSVALETRLERDGTGVELLSGSFFTVLDAITDSPSEKKVAVRLPTRLGTTRAKTRLSEGLALTIRKNELDTLNAHWGFGFGPGWPSLHLLLTIMYRFRHRCHYTLASFMRNPDVTSYSVAQYPVEHGPTRTRLRRVRDRLLRAALATPNDSLGCTTGTRRCG